MYPLSSRIVSVIGRIGPFFPSLLRAVPFGEVILSNRPCGSYLVFLFPSTFSIGFDVKVICCGCKCLTLSALARFPLSFFPSLSFQACKKVCDYCDGFPPFVSNFDRRLAIRRQCVGTLPHFPPLWLTLGPVKFWLTREPFSFPPL